MAHTTQSQTTPIIDLITVTVTDYTSGGETITKDEVEPTNSLLLIKGIFPTPVSPSQNSLNSVLFPILLNGKLVLTKLVSGTFQEIPTTIGLNAVVNALVVLGVISN